MDRKNEYIAVFDSGVGGISGQTEDQQSKDHKQELVAQIGKLPCVTDGL